ncbi:MAG: polysaccharide biosynthesis tyrosine autokinase [Calothrix sp. C42_A2020_038]|nr:polysaccharide biosynthesis tyrosine autokinase [Calothrix sp. C42_A2020_038]
MVLNTLKHKQLLTISSSNAVDIRKLTQILFRRRFLIVGIAGLAVSVVSILTVSKPKYESSMQIIINPNLYSNNKINSQNDEYSNLTDSDLTVVDYDAQLQMMQNIELIQKVVALLRPNYPNIKVEDIKGNKGKSPLSITRVEPLSSINPVSSQVFEIRYKAYDPVKTQRVLQALFNVYKNYSTEQQKQRLTRGMAFLDERLPKIKNRVVIAERNLEAFRKKNNILDPEAQSKILFNTLAEIQKQLQIINAQLQDAQVRYTALQQKIGVIPTSTIILSRLNQSIRYKTLLNEINKTDLALAQERVRYTENSPIVQKLVQQRQNQLDSLRKELTKILVEKSENNTSQPESEIEAAVNQALNQVRSSDSLLDERQTAIDINLAQEMIQTQIIVQALQANHKSLSQSEKHLQSQLSKYPALIAEYNRLLPEVQTSRKTLEQLMQAQQTLSLKIAQGGFDWQIVEAPEYGVYINSGGFLILGSGTLVGLVIGTVVAIVLEAFRDSIHTLNELRNFTNSRLLGTIPLLPLNRRRQVFLPMKATKKLVADSLIGVGSLPSHDMLDIAYQNIQISNSCLLRKSLMVTSASSGEGKSTITLGLAASSARTHHRVLVIDANLREPCLHKQLDLQNEWGLSILLVDQFDSPFKDYIQPIHPSIDVLTAGPFLEDTVKLLSSQRMKELLEELEQSYDLVLIDAPPILNTVDSRILATLCGAIVLVVRLGQATRANILQTTEILEKLNLIGIIANQAPIET